MKKTYNILWLLIALLASACRISKDVKTPNDYIPSAYRNSATADTQTIANIHWQDFFPDETLRQLIDTALVRNFDMQLTIKNLEIAHQSLKQARMSLVPAVGLNVAASSTVPSKNSLNGSLTSQFLGREHIEDFSANIGISWEADIWGKVRNRKRSALAAYLQTAEARKAVQTGIITIVAQSYYNLLMLDEQLKVAQRNVRLTDSTVRILQLQQEAGQVTALATQQAMAQQLVATQLIPQLEQDIELVENNLSILTGSVPQRVERNTELGNLEIPTSLPAGIPAQMVSNRPDVKSRELALTVANARVGLAKANFYPALNITATGGVNSFKASNWFNLPASLFGVVTGAIAQPLLQRRAIRTNYNIAKIEREKTVIEFKQSVLQAVSEVSGAMVKIEKLNEQYRVASSRAEVLQQATKNAQLLFQSGMANYLEVITAQSNSLQSELALANIKLAHLNAVTELYRAVGGGWK
jgi:NodT family efflux transporter outer membrane factor (OMF) lipoprotein